MHNTMVTTGRIAKKTRFDTVEIRNYPFVLSDNPGGKYGPSIELGWEYINEPIKSSNDASKNAGVLNLNAYEKQRQGKRKNRLYLSHLERESMLLEAGYSEEDLARAIHRKNSIRRGMLLSNLLMNPVTKMQMKLQGERRIRKLGRANTNLKAMQKNGDMFYEHSEIYRSWADTLTDMFKVDNVQRRAQ